MTPPETDIGTSGLIKIRTISNVIQALENLQIQCDGKEEFDGLEEFAHSFLEELRIRLKIEIHHEE